MTDPAAAIRFVQVYLLTIQAISYFIFHHGQVKRNLTCRVRGVLLFLIYLRFGTGTPSVNATWIALEFTLEEIEFTLEGIMLF
jgi:hypothetical protein